MGTDRIQIALLGVGVVGEGILRLLRDNASTIEERLGAPIDVTRMVARSRNKVRDSLVPEAQLEFDPMKVVSDPDVDIIIEVMGGIEPALGIVRSAIENGKHVVTANKALIAEHGDELLELAERKGVDLYYEAAVAGGVPILRVIREALASDRIVALRGIVNGTSNYILSRMRDAQLDFAEALREAQEKGYAEADPSLDINGGDSAHKLTILATLAFGAKIALRDVYVQGIEEVAAIDMSHAERFGYVVKPLAVARVSKDGKLDLRTHPALVGKNKPLANINGALNAVFVEGAMLGPCLLSGLGAGAMPTAMSVVSDIVDVSRNMRSGTSGRVPSRSVPTKHLVKQPVQRMDDLRMRYYLRVPVADRPGVLAKVSSILGTHEVSIEQMIQDPQRDPETGATSIIMLTHEAREGSVREAMAAIENIDDVVEKPRVLRIDA